MDLSNMTAGVNNTAPANNYPNATDSAHEQTLRELSQNLAELNRLLGSNGGLRTFQELITTLNNHTQALISFVELGRSQADELRDQERTMSELNRTMQDHTRAMQDSLRTMQEHTAALNRG